VRVADFVLRSVGFIGEATSADSAELQGDLHATGFFVAAPSSLPGRSYAFFVTAKHVADDLKDRAIYFLVNKKGGGVTALDSYADDWWFHPTDRTADVAVLPCNPGPEADVLPISTADFATPQVMDERRIGIGDEVFATGLFTPAPGLKQNWPIVRHGNIAMLPTEQIQTELGYADVILVEARSIGGLSGSPVFVRETIGSRIYMEDDQSEATLAGLGRTYLLGLMHGHWDIRESELNKASFAHDSKRGVNLGIGIVVPSQKIIETINRPELKRVRDERDAKAKAKQVPRMDSVHTDADEQMFTKEDFEDALKRASRRIQPLPPDEGKSGT
jgi:hypothetical protein